MNTGVMQSDPQWRGKPLSPELESIVSAMRADTQSGPGRYLRQIRESLGMSVKQVASLTSVGIHQLTALENDDYENLPAPIFVRSYLRRCSDVLGVPFNDLVESYERFGLMETPTLARVSLRERLSSRNISSRWAIGSAIGVLFLLLMYWWQSPSVDEPASAPLVTETPKVEMDGSTVTKELPLPPPANAESLSAPAPTETIPPSETE